MFKAGLVFFLLLSTACSASTPSPDSPAVISSEAPRQAVVMEGAGVLAEPHRDSVGPPPSGEPGLFLPEAERALEDLPPIVLEEPTPQAQAEGNSEAISAESVSGTFFPEGDAVSDSEDGSSGKPGPAEAFAVEVASREAVKAPASSRTTSSRQAGRSSFSYVVKDGETLWTIASQRSVYRDALLWPLLYRANRDQIKDPRQIYPQQVLTIPRDVSAEEMEAAREKARRSEIFPLSVLLRQVAEGE